MGALMRAHDWSASGLGAPQVWSPSLRVAVRLMLNTGHPMYIFWGESGACLYNDAYRGLIGPERHPSSLGRPAREIWSETWPIIGPQIEQVMSGGGATWQENALVPITRNGVSEDVYWTYSYGPIDDETASAGIGGVLVVCTETTKAVSAERTLSAAVEQQQRVFEQAPGFICILKGHEHVFEFVNAAHRELFGSGDWVGKPAREAIPDLTGQGFFELLDRVYQTGERHVAYGAEARYRTSPSGPERTILMDFIYAPVLGDDGRVTGIFSEGFDVTDRYRAQAALSDSEEQLRLATEAAEVGLWDVDVVTDTLFWPPRVKAMFGISADVPVSMADYYAGLHPEDRDATSAAFAAATDPDVRALYDVEYRTIGKEDGVVRWVAAKGRGVFDDDGRCVRVIGVAVDISPRRLVEAQLRELNATLEQRVEAQAAQMLKAGEQLRQAQKIEAIGQLTGGVAHDFNNLLMVITGGLSLLDRNPDAEKRQRITDGMRQAAERGADLSRQLLAFARRKPLKAVSVDLQRQIGGMHELLDRTLRGDVTVRTRFPSDLWPVQVDPAELELVLLNLCVNARDAMPRGGAITISAANRPCGSGSPHDVDMVELSVIDTGQGMSPEVRDKMFEPFFTTKEIGKGSGLGLPQVHGFVQQSGGAIAVESVEGEGTTIVLSLPRAEHGPMRAPARDPGRPAEATVAGGAVLLVEDDDEVAALVSELFAQLGWTVVRAESAGAALGALADDRQVDMVLSDVMMPGGMSGIDLARELRRRRPDLPILLTSGYAEAVARQCEVERIALLAKPYRIEDLAAALTRISSKASDRTGSHGHGVRA